MFMTWITHRTLSGEKEFINLAHVVVLRFDPYLSRMKLLLRNGTEICILIPPQWREVIENELFGGIKSAGFVVDLTELPPARLSPEESALLDKIINDAINDVLFGHESKSEATEKENDERGDTQCRK